MYCPKCGNQQISDLTKFCVKCGLSLVGAAQMLGEPGGLQVQETRRLSRRARGVLQGLAIVPTALGAWLALDIFFERFLDAGMLGGLYAMVTLIVLVAVGRIMYAMFYQGGPRRPPRDPAAELLELHSAERAGTTNVLPTPYLSDIYGPAIVPPAGEFAPPHSVTDSTTRKLK